jgi:hypothetical protein
MLDEHRKKPQWDEELRERIYNHLRQSWRMREFNPDDALWHLNEAVALLYVAECPNDPPLGVFHD